MSNILIRPMELMDAEFVLDLYNQPAFIQYIADKQIKNIDDAKAYITHGPKASHQHFGHGLDVIIDAEKQLPVGVCGLLQRAELSAPDLGYAISSQFVGLGYAYQACQIAIAQGFDTLITNEILAIVSLHNIPSIGLLEKLNFVRVESMIWQGEKNWLYRLTCEK